MRRFARELLGGQLWSNHDFLRLWFGQSVSEVGTQVSVIALPSVLILVLHGTPFQVGLLSALEFASFPVLGLVAGVWADRLYRRTIMVACDLGRLALLASVPFAYLAGRLTIAQLFVVAAGVGLFNVFFAVCYQSYLPTLVHREDLVEGNSKLELSVSGAYLLGPALAGFLVQLVGAARTIFFDAASYLVSAVSLLSIRSAEPMPVQSDQRPRFATEMAEGVRAVTSNLTLLRIAGCTATGNLGVSISWTLLLVFSYHTLHLRPATVGLVLGVGALGAIVGALLAGRISAWLGLRPTLLLSTLLASALGLIPLAGVGPAIPILGLLYLVHSFANPIYDVNQVSLRQSLLEDRLLGRANATIRTLVSGTIPVGALLAAVLASTVGVAGAIWVGGAVAAASAIWLLPGRARFAELPGPGLPKPAELR